MTKTKCTPAEGLAAIGKSITQTQRRLKVRPSEHSYQLDQNYNDRTPVGQIHLKGNWLIQAGFNIDSNVTISVMHGCLIIQAE